MNKILSIFTLFVLFIIGFIHSPMMIFAATNNSSEMMMGNMESNSCMENDIDNGCDHICCIEQGIDHGLSNINNNFNKKLLKVIKEYSNIFINNEILYSFENKNLLNSNSPPYLDREIINYSYHTLIKIIKSNT